MMNFKLYFYDFPHLKCLQKNFTHENQILRIITMHASKIKK